MNAMSDEEVQYVLRGIRDEATRNALKWKRRRGENAWHFRKWDARRQACDRAIAALGPVTEEMVQRTYDAYWTFRRQDESGFAAMRAALEAARRQV